jgi:outer membrane lipoprotein
MKWISLLSLLFITACANNNTGYYADDSVLIRQQFTQMAQPNNPQNWLVKWSGVIAQTRNLATGTEVEVVYLPLSYNGIPQQSEQSPGRFIALFPQLLDPVLYAKGRSITVSGTSGPSREGKIGESPYRFAVMNATEHKLWPIVKEVEVRYERPLFDDGFYYHHRIAVPR